MAARAGSSSSSKLHFEFRQNLTVGVESQCSAGLVLRGWMYALCQLVGLGPLPLDALARIGIDMRICTLPVADKEAQASRAGAQDEQVRRQELSDEARPQNAMLLLSGLNIEQKDAICTVLAAEQMAQGVPRWLIALTANSATSFLHARIPFLNLAVLL